MYFQISVLHGWVKRPAAQPQTIYSEVPKDNAFVSFKFRALTFREMNYKQNEDAAIQAVGNQYLALGEYLVGEDFSAVKDLYAPANIASDVDGFTAATIRSAKIISALNDALARGVYKLA